VSEISITYLLNQERQSTSPQRINDAPIGLLSIHFTGRETELDLIRDALSKVQNDRSSCCGVHGMPGVGKSQLVLRYATISSDSSRYSYIFFISATNVDKLNQGLSKVLDLVHHPDRHVQEQSRKLTAARLWLEEREDDWLLVFDNVDRSSLDFLRMHLPRRNARGNILFTTRTGDVADALVNIARQDSTLRLRTMERCDTAHLLLKDGGFAVTPTLLDHAGELVECVGRLPLAVVQATSFMKQTGTALDRMLELYQSEQKIEVSSYTLL
jgi:hypothetical protein